MLRRMSFYALSSKPLLKAKLSANKEREKKKSSLSLCRTRLQRRRNHSDASSKGFRVWPVLVVGVSDGMGLL
ncbi:hypothetical protein E1A91_A05G085200v1 [Gossypium mustelinum]|uniref:Uncharacterized protein n=1 Tax=Gossypium mustelinum TaxID=34275 RepID=A0A5D2Z4N7_GOSMU|nr:hypothetical protein E1A91_A05G085200v1 [Gossypium mustelinum]